MADNEKTSTTIGSIAARGLRKPESLTMQEVRALAASALTQRPDQPVSLPAKKKKAVKATKDKKKKATKKKKS